jgi:hypothetical protein
MAHAHVEFQALRNVKTSAACATDIETVTVFGFPVLDQRREVLVRHVTVCAFELFQSRMTTYMVLELHLALEG